MSNNEDEKEKRRQELGCPECRYKNGNYMVCGTVLELSDRFNGICPYFREKMEETK